MFNIYSFNSSGGAICMKQQDNEREAQYIIESKRRCLELGMDPSAPVTPRNIMSQSELAHKKKAYSNILEVVRFFSKKIIKSLEGTPILIGISDENGYLLDTLGDKTIEFTMAEIGIKPGVQFTQDG